MAGAEFLKRFEICDLGVSIIDIVVYQSILFQLYH